MALTRFRLSQLTQSGANDGDVPVWSDAQNKWIPGAGGGGGGVPTSRLINTTSPLTGGGDLSADRTLGLAGLTTFGAAGDFIRSFGTSWIYQSAADVATSIQGFIDHGSLSGLLNDNHTQYVKNTGRVGGQSILAGTGAGEGWIINATTHATPGLISLLETGGSVRIGGAATASGVRWREPNSGGTIHFTELIAQAQTANITYTWPATSTNGFLKNTAGILSWDTPTAAAAGSVGNVQFHGADGNLDGDDTFVFNTTTGRLAVGDASGITSLDFRFTVATINDLQGILIDGAIDSQAGQPQILIRKSRGNYTTRTPAFTGDNLGRIAWHGFADDSPDVFKPACEIMTMGLNNPTAGQPYFPTTMTIKVGAFNGVKYVTAISFSGGNNVFVDQPRVAVGDGTVAGNAAFEVAMTSTNEAGTHWHNAVGDMWFGINGSGNIILTKSGFSNTNTKIAITSSQIFFNQGTNNYGFYGEVVVEGDGTGILFEICREGTPGNNVIMAFTDWSTNRHIEILENGGALWNKQKNNTDFIIHGDNDDNVFCVDGSADAVGIGIGAPLARLHIFQSSTTGAKPVVTLNQADVDEDFFKFIGTSDTSVDRALVDAANFPTPGTIAGWLKINIQDDQGTNPIADGDYYIPFYTAPT